MLQKLLADHNSNRREEEERGGVNADLRGADILPEFEIFQYPFQSVFHI